MTEKRPATDAASSDAASSDIASRDTALHEATSARHAALDAALAAALRPPATPPDLRAGVLAAMARERPADLQVARRELQQQHRAALTALNRQYLRRCRDALLVGSGLLAAVGFCTVPLSHWLAPFFADAAPMVAGCAMLIVGALCGAALLRELSQPSAGQPWSSRVAGR